MLDLGRTLGSGDVEIIGREPVPEAAAPGMDLHEERLGLQAALQLDEVVPPAEAPDLLDTALGFSPSSSTGSRSRSQWLRSNASPTNRLYAGAPPRTSASNRSFVIALSVRLRPPAPISTRSMTAILKARRF